MPLVNLDGYDGPKPSLEGALKGVLASLDFWDLKEKTIFWHKRIDIPPFKNYSASPGFKILTWALRAMVVATAKRSIMANIDHVSVCW